MEWMAAPKFQIDALPAPPRLGFDPYPWITGCPANHCQSDHDPDRASRRHNQSAEQLAARAWSVQKPRGQRRRTHDRSGHPCQATQTSGYAGDTRPARVPGARAKRDEEQAEGLLIGS